MNFWPFSKHEKISSAFSFDDVLRFVSVQRHQEGVQVIAYGSYALDSVMDAMGTITNEAVLVKKLTSIAEKFDIKEANIVVPDNQAFMFHTHVAKESPREMGDVIIDHIRAYCQAHELLEYSAYICEYDIILETQFGYDVHVTLVPKTYVAHLVRLFKQAGITVPHIETAHHAVARECLRIPNGTGYVAVSIGRTKTAVSLVHGEHLVSHDVIDFGIETLLGVLEKCLGISSSQANHIITKHGVLRSHPDMRVLSELHVALGPVIRSIDRQLITVGTMPYKHYGLRFATKDVVVYGEGVTIKGLPQLIGEQAKLDARVLDVWAGRTQERAPILRLPASEMPMYAEALALALLYLE